MIRSRHAARTVTLVGVATLVAGCSHLVAGTPRLAGAPLPPAAPVQWGSCQTDGADDLPKDAQCGELTVPVDYADPDGGTATLALLRFPATGSVWRLSVVCTNLRCHAGLRPSSRISPRTR